MKSLDRLIPIFVVGVLLLGVGVVGVRWIWPEGAMRSGVVVPPFSPVAAKGETAYNATCAQCHGNNAAGTDQGPPLVHDIYNPGHHADEAFLRATRRGVPQHHWPYGDMPPQRGVSDEDLAAIVRYIREMQEANGIFYRRHTM